MGQPETITVKYSWLEMIRNLLTNVDAKNKISKAFLESSIGELDSMLEKAAENGNTRA